MARYVNANAIAQHSLLHDLTWLAVRVAHAAPVPVSVWALLALVDATFSVAELWAMRGAVNALVLPGTAGALAGILPWMVALGALFAVQQAVQVLQPYLRERVRLAAGFTLQGAGLQQMGRLPVEAFDHEQVHDLIRRVADGADTRVPALIENTLGLIQLLPVVVANALVLGLISPWLPVIIAGAEAFLLWHGARMGTRERRFEVERTRQRRLADYYGEMLTARGHAAEMRLWGLQGEILHRWREAFTGYLSGRLRLSLANSLQGVGSSVGFAVVVTAAPLTVTLLGGRVEAGLAALLLSATRNVTAGMNMMLRSARGFMEQAGYAADLRQLREGLEPEEPASPPAVAGKEPEAPAGQAEALASQGGPWLHFPRPVTRGLHLQGVGYRYPGAAVDALCGIDVTIRAGESIALVGANGAGKSTLASILVGLRRPTAGSVRVDGIDLAQIRPSEIRRACTAVFQQPVRYPTTLRANIAPATGPGERAALEAVQAKAGLDGEALAPDVLLGPEFGGIDLSGGQWQRLSIARALFRSDAEILVFDEPTAALDPLAELALFQQFAELAAGHTTILISHRLGPARLADRVLVLDGGRLVEEGPPARLLAGGGRFAQMFAAQAEWYQ